MSEICAKSLQSCLTLCDPVDCSLSVSSAHEILQARILEWVAMPFSMGSSWPRDWTHISCGFCTAGRFLLLSHQGSPDIYPAAAAAKLHQSCRTLCHPMDCSLPGSSVHGIFQARVLEWFASAFSDIPWENHNSKRSIHPNVHCSTIYNSQDMNAT